MNSKANRKSVLLSAVWVSPGIIAAVLLFCSVIFWRPEAGAASPGGSYPPWAVYHVLHISVDGLRPDAVTNLGATRAPNFYRLRIEGAFTDNARTDYDFTNTLPNHTCELTGRPVLGPDGHMVDFNWDNGATIEAVKGSYVQGVFDVVHDNGGSTGMYAGKEKFDFLRRSWDETHGAYDTTGTDDGYDKIDRYVNLAVTEDLVDSLIAHLIDSPAAYTFIHFVDLDATGHEWGWNSGRYYEALMEIDRLLGRIFRVVDEDEALRGKTALIVTSDHGGEDRDHSDETDQLNYTVPFYTWGPGIPSGGDLYSLNELSREDPIDARPGHSDSPQPIRNGDSGNLALDLLGLSAMNGSLWNAGQDLSIISPDGFGDLPQVDITAPADGDFFSALDTIIIKAEAFSAGGSISRVEFYAGWDLIGEDDSPPYQCLWPRVPLGDYAIAARAVRYDSLASVDKIDVSITSLASSEEAGNPCGIIHRVFPNPASSVATLGYYLPRSGNVAITFYDVAGRESAHFIFGWRGEGSHNETVNLGKLAPGFYFYKLTACGVLVSGKALVTR